MSGNVFAYIYIYIYIFKQVLLKMIEHCLSSSVLFFKCLNKKSNCQLKTKLPLMTTKSMVKRAWAEDMGQFLYPLDHDTRIITRKLGKIKSNIIN